MLSAEFLGPDSAGTMLPSERLLSDRFGVSRPFVREVLSGLQERGLIEIVPGRGAFVREAGMFNLAGVTGAAYRRQAVTPRQVMQARAMLEQESAASAAENASADDMAAMRRAIDACDTARDLLARTRADIAFHSLVARASGNPVLQIMFGSISTLVFEVMLRGLSDPETLRQSAPFHHSLLAAIEAGDAEAARTHAAAHLEVAQRTYGADMDESIDRLAENATRGVFWPSDSFEQIVASALEEFAPSS